jgi:ABC-type transport system involved in multi-copper enzyme maturation permease subunit
MIRTIAAKEMLDQVSSPKFVFLFVVATVLILFSLYTGSGAYTAARGEYQATEALSRRELENRRNYFEVSQFGVKVARQPSPLSAVATGVSSALGRSARVRPQQQPEFAPPPLADTPVLAVLGELDFAVVVRVFLSLFVLLLTYGAIAGEKESGTLKAVLANPVPRTQLLIGKVVGLFGVFAAATLVPTILGVLIMKVGFGIELSGGDWARLATIGTAGGLYLLAVFAVGILASTATSRSAVAFLVLLLIWVAFVEVIPKSSPMIASRIRPAPSYAELQSERDRLQAEFQRGMFSVMSAAFARAGGSDAPGGEVTPEEGARRQAMIDSIMNRGRDSLQEDLNSRLAAVDEAYHNRQDGMTRLALLLSRLSPAAAMGHAVETMAGTDFEMHSRWRDDLIRYRAGLEAYLKEKGVTLGGFRMVVRTESRTQGGRTANTMRIGGPEDDSRLDLASMPQFRAQPESYASALGRAAPDLVIMALWAAGALLVAFARFMKYDVR